jgi:hypothetical protein
VSFDLDAALEALAKAGASAPTAAGVPPLTPVWWMPNALGTVPAFVVAEVDIAYDATFGRTPDDRTHEYTVTCRVLTQHTDDKAAAALINGTLAGPGSVKKAIEVDRTLGGACKTLIVTQVNGRRLFQWGGAAEYLGTQILVSLWG